MTIVQILYGVRLNTTDKVMLCFIGHMNIIGIEIQLLNYWIIFAQFLFNSELESTSLNGSVWSPIFESHILSFLPSFFAEGASLISIMAGIHLICSNAGLFSHLKRRSNGLQRLFAYPIP